MICTVIEICAALASRWECFAPPGVLEGRGVREEGKARSVDDESRNGEGKLRNTERHDLDFFP